MRPRTRGYELTNPAAIGGKEPTKEVMLEKNGGPGKADDITDGEGITTVDGRRQSDERKTRGEGMVRATMENKRTINDEQRTVDIRNAFVPSKRLNTFKADEKNDNDKHVGAA